MKITKKMRDEAILILDICASTGTTTGEVSWFLGNTWSYPPERLAAKAWEYVDDHTPRYSYERPAVYAEAAQLLREGWTP